MSGFDEALKALVNWSTLLAFVLLVVPGTISLRIYDRIRSRQSRNITESLFDIVIVSFINDALWMHLSRPIDSAYKAHVVPAWWISSQFIVAIIISPIALALLYALLEDQLAKRGVVTDAEASPWDKWFREIKSKKLQIAIILVMKSDHRVIGGRYQPPGFASSTPASREIHLGETWLLNTRRQFVRPIGGSKGVIVNMEDVETIEFFEWSMVELNYGKADDEE